MSHLCWATSTLFGELHLWVPRRHSGIGLLLYLALNYRLLGVRHFTGFTRHALILLQLGSFVALTDGPGRREIRARVGERLLLYVASGRAPSRLVPFIALR